MEFCTRISNTLQQDFEYFTRFCGNMICTRTIIYFDDGPGANHICLRKYRMQIGYKRRHGSIYSFGLQIKVNSVPLSLHFFSERKLNFQRTGYLEEDEAREYGLKKEKKGNKRKRVELMDANEDEVDEEVDGGEDADGGDDEELELLELADDDDVDDENKMENARYENFFGRKGTGQKKSYTRHGALQGSDMGDEDRKKQNLSNHEKEQDNLRAKTENMEKANLEPKTWTMQGEITASKRPKNSALEVDLDFEHNVRPAPVITEEFTASIEEMIQKRVLEARFDDMQKPPDLLHNAPREKRELDENKSTKGLAEVYEDEYAQKMVLVSVALSFSDERKKEATTLFKKLCLKLDALSHFNFTPKPVIEV